MNIEVFGILKIFFEVFGNQLDKLIFGLASIDLWSKKHRSDSLSLMFIIDWYLSYFGHI